MPERVDVSGQVGIVASEETVDLGDVVLPRGCRVSGRLADARGVTPAKTVVMLARDPDLFGPTSRSRLQTHGGESVSVAADGTFTFRKRYPPGPYHADYVLAATGASTRGPAVVIGRDQREATVEITCASPDALPAIVGTVVDEQGAPIAGAVVTCGRARRNEGRTRSAADGSFRLVRTMAAVDEPLWIRVEGEGLEPTTSEPREGDSVTLVVARLPDVELTVVARESGAAVEEYAVRFFPDPLCYGGNSGRPRLRVAGEHPGGSADLLPFRFGRHLLVVEPSGDHLAPSRVVVVDVQRTTPPVRVELPPIVARPLLVVQRDGMPVAGTRIELVAPSREIAIGPTSRVVPPDFSLLTIAGSPPDSLYFSETLTQHAEALLLQAGTTDALGSLELRAGAREDLALHVRGPGHPPLFVAKVDLTMTGPLRIEVPSSGRIVGTVAPAVVARELRAGVRLVSAADPQRQLPETPTPDAPGFAIGEDGGFACTGVPLGDWHVFLAFRHTNADHLRHVGQIVGLRAGETRRLTLDASTLRPGRVRVKVMLDGTPAAGARVALRGTVRQDDGPRVFAGRVMAAAAALLVCTADTGGEIVADLVPGTYGLTVLPRDAQPWQDIASPEPIVVAPGADLETTRALRRIRLRVRVLDADGRPARERTFFLLGEGLAPRPPLLADRDGLLLVEPAPLVPFVLATWPPELATADAQRAIVQQGREAMERTMLRVGPILVAGDEADAARELRLPVRPGGG